MRKTSRRGRGLFSQSILLLFLLLILIFATGYFLDCVRTDHSVPDPVQPSGSQQVKGAVSAPAQSGEQTAAPEESPYALTELGAGAVYTGDLLLVNNWTLYHFPEEQPLECIYDGKTKSYYVRDKDVYLAPVALEALNNLLDAFRAQGGSRTVNVIAGYRTEVFQQHLFDQSAERNGEPHARRFVAQPGGSEHHTGLVVDLSVLRANGISEDYDGQGEYAWINENCQDYGWVVRYEEAKEEITGIGDEPWHFRYVGVPHATVMAEEDMCLEEYIDYLKNYPYDGQHLLVDCASGRYEIWYCPGTAAYLPEDGEYTISGNNVDGVVVTWKIA